MQFHSDDDSGSCSPCQAAQQRRVGYGARKRTRSPSPGKKKKSFKSDWIKILMRHSEGDTFEYKGKRYRKGKGITARPVRKSGQKKKKKKSGQKKR